MASGLWSRRGSSAQGPLTESRRRFLRPLVEQLERRDLLAAAPVMLKDLSPLTGSSVENDAVHGHRVVEMDGLYYFAATTPATGLELWRTDGTPENTQLVVDLAQGPQDGLSPTKSLWKGPDGNLYFVGSNPGLGLQRLRSGQSTPEFVAATNFPDLNPFPNQGAIFRNRLYYPAPTKGFWGDPEGIEPAWFDFTTGLPNGVFDVMPGPQSSFPTAFTVAGDYLFILANGTFDNLPELWKYDGDQPPSALPLYFEPGSTFKLTAAGDHLYVAVMHPTQEDYLVMVRPGHSPHTVVTTTTLLPHTFQAFGTDVVFGTYDDYWGHRISRTTNGGLDTALLAYDLSGIADQRGVAHVMNGEYYFFASHHNPNQLFLWKSDGTYEGTAPVTELATPVPTTGFDMVSTESQLFFLAHHDEHDFGLWTSDGTAAGTEFVMSTTAETPNPALLPPVAFDGKVFFAADNGTHGRETWVLNVEPTPPPDLVAGGLRIVGGQEVKWGQGARIAFEVSNWQGPVDQYKVQIILSGDPTISASGGADYTLDILPSTFWAPSGLPANGTLTIETLVSMPQYPPEGFNFSGKLYIGVNVDPDNEVEESNEANNIGQGLGIDALLVRDVPQVLQVVTHGIDLNFDLSTGFDATWRWYHPEKLWQLAASTSLAGKTGTYSVIWNSAAGWTRALVDLVAQAWLGTEDAVDLPPELIAELRRYADADLQYALERATREIEFTAQRAVQDLHTRGDLMGPAARQKIHLIGMGSGAAVNARIAQLLHYQGYTVSLFTTLDGWGTDWAGPAAELTEVSLDTVPASRRVNYRVETALEDPLTPGGTTSGIEQLVNKSLRKLLGRPINLEIDTSIFDEWRAPLRPTPFENVTILGESANAPSNHFNVAERYFNAGRAAADLAWLATAPLPTPRAPVASPPPALISDFHDGSLERFGGLADMIESLAPFAAADDFTRTWLEAVDTHQPMVTTNWQVNFTATVGEHEGDQALIITQGTGLVAPNVGQGVWIPPNAVLTFDLSSKGSIAPHNQFTISFTTHAGTPTVYNLRLTDASAYGPKSVSLSDFAGQIGTLNFILGGGSSNPPSLVIDNLQIRIAGDIGSATATVVEETPDTLALQAVDSVAMPGTVNGVRYYVESNGQIGLQIGSDRLLGQSTNSSNNWRVEIPTFGLKYGYEQLYAVAYDGGVMGPVTPIHLFLGNPPDEHPYHRASDPLDVNGDGSVQPIDALIIINALNAGLTGDLTIPDRVPFPFDTTADNRLEPIDALLVINLLNAQVGQQLVGGEGAAEASAAASDADDVDALEVTDNEYDAALLALMEVDPRSKRARRG